MQCKTFYTLMKFFTKILVLMLCLSDIVIADEDRLVIMNDDYDFLCSATFEQSLGKATFLFHDVVPDEEYRWNKSSVKDNMMEYGWEVYLEDISSDIGFSYYKGPFEEQRGPLDELFNKGQLSIFKHDGMMMNVVDQEKHNSLSITVINKDIRIEVLKEKNTENIFSDKSEYVNFWIFEASMSPKKCRVKKEIKLQK